MPGILYPGGSTPIPLCPSRRIRACPERVRMRLPSSRGQVNSKGGFVSGPARHADSSEKSVSAFPDMSNARLKVEAPIARAANRLTAFSFEFVAKPEQAVGAPLFLPAAIQSGLEDIAGFAGTLVMASDQEARLVTVIIFWSGSEARGSCERSVRRIRALLAPYVDRCLRVQNLLAHLPRPQEFPQPSSIDNCFINGESVAEEANIRLA
jgi:hypothetical protein